MNSNNGIFVGFLAGLAGGLMAIAALRAGPAALAMLFAAPIAVYLASLGWGTVSGAIAALIAAGISMMSGGLTSFVVTAALLFAPAAWCGHLANLGQRDSDGQMIWYPLAGIFVRLMLAVTAGVIVTGALLGYQLETLQTLMVDLLRDLATSNDSQVAVDDAVLVRNAHLYAGLIPFIVPAVWMAVHTAVFYLAAVVARRSGKMARPRDDIPQTANLPFGSLGLPLAGLAGMMIAPSPVYEISAVFAGTGISAFAMVGLAEMHLKSQGRPGRGLLLFASYLLIFLFTLPIAIFAIMGMARAWARRPSPPSPPAVTDSGAE